METRRIVTIAAASIGVLALVGAVLIKRRIDASNAAKEAQLNSLNADRDDWGPWPYKDPSTPEERARIQAELDAKNAKNAKMDAGSRSDVPATSKDAQTRNLFCYNILDATPVASCAPGDSLCVCDAPPDR